MNLKYQEQHGMKSITCLMDVIPYQFHSIFQNYLKYIIKKHETLTDKSPVEIFVDRIQKRVTFVSKSLAL